MPAKFIQPNFATQDAGTYKAAIDASAAAMKSIGNASAPHQSSPPAMNITLEPGMLIVTTGGIVWPAEQVTGNMAAPTGGNYRYDLVVRDKTTGAVSIVTGTPGLSNPAIPALPADKFPMGIVLLYTGMTQILDADIIDARCFLDAR